MMNTPAPLPALPPGLCHSEHMVVAPVHSVPRVGHWPGFADMPPVFATAMMIGFMEQTCIQALRPYLTASQRTVGTHVDMNHIAATPVGMKVVAEIELVEAKGKSLTFRVRCSDDAGLIGEGVHQRAIIDVRRFQERLAGRAAAA